MQIQISKNNVLGASVKFCLILLIAAIGLCVACSNPHSGIIIPAFCSVDKNGRGNGYKKTMIVYYNGACASCFLKKSRQWHLFIKHAETDNDFRFIMLLPEKDSADVNNFTKFDSPDFPIFCDKNNLFLNHNKKYLKGSVCVFLLDEKDKILLKGNPTYNKKLWNRYLELTTGHK